MVIATWRRGKKLALITELFCTYMELLCCVSRGKTERVRPGRGIIGTTQGQGVYRRGRLYKGAFATTQRDAPTQTISGYQQTRTPRKSLARAIPRSNHPSAGFSLFLQRRGMCQVCITISLDNNLLKSVQVRLFRTLCDIKCVKNFFGDSNNRGLG